MRTIVLTVFLLSSFFSVAQESVEGGQMFEKAIGDSLAKAVIKTFYLSVKKYNGVAKKKKLPLMTLKKDVASLKVDNLNVQITPALMLFRSVRVNGKTFHFFPDEDPAKSKKRFLDFLQNTKKVSTFSPLGIFFPVALADPRVDISASILTYIALSDNFFMKDLSEHLEATGRGFYSLDELFNKYLSVKLRRCEGGQKLENIDDRMKTGTYQSIKYIVDTEIDFMTGVFHAGPVDLSAFKSKVDKFAAELRLKLEEEKKSKTKNNEITRDSLLKEVERNRASCTSRFVSYYGSYDRQWNVAIKNYLTLGGVATICKKIEPIMQKLKSCYLGFAEKNIKIIESTRNGKRKATEGTPQEDMYESSKKLEYMMSIPK